MLFSLPRELRDVIYGLVLPDGHLGILRVDKFINAEATTALYKERVCLMYVGYPRPKCPQDHRLRPGRFCDLIQNYELRVNLQKPMPNYGGLRFSGPPWQDFVMEPVKGFGDPDICRKSMVIKLDPNLRHSWLDDGDTLEQLFDRPWCLVGFRTVVIMFLEVGRDKRLGIDWSDVKKMARGMLDPILGPAVCSDEEEGQCVKYKPWEFVSRHCWVQEGCWAYGGGSQGGFKHTRFMYRHGRHLDTLAKEADTLGNEEDEDKDEEEEDLEDEASESVKSEEDSEQSVSEKDGAIDGSEYGGTAGESTEF